MGMSQSYDIGNFIKGVSAVANVSTPSSSGAALTGITIDRWAYGRRYESAKAVVNGHFAGSTQQVATVAMAFQHSSDGTSWDSFSTATNAATAIGSTGATGAQTVEGSAEQAVSLVGARRYIRQVMVPTFSGGTSGDSLYFQGTVVLAGSDETPNT